jgi:hypothetical protein
MEHSREVGLITEPALQSNLGERILMGPQQSLGLGNSALRDIVTGCFVERLSEGVAEMTDA